MKAVETRRTSRPFSIQSPVRLRQGTIVQSLGTGRMVENHEVGSLRSKAGAILVRNSDI